VAEELAARGIYCHGPALPGHNTTPDELAEVSFTDWLECARAEAGALRQGYERVFVVGMSMGGLLSLSLAAGGDVDALAVAGTPLAFRQPIPLLVPWVKHLLPFRTKPGGPDIRDPAARERHPCYGVMPLASVHELIRLQAHVNERLDRITVPIFVAHGAHDRTANPRDAQRIIDGVSASEHELHICEHSGHIVTVDRDGPSLASAVGDFFERQL
jgi:carboxylesterase